ncbi:hypothetical protein [uncultured Arcticibacterium sp.]|uniref:hypothetical protein n=1 Tax=uncultured Arcticibacterium sp. TaxID=2173042 RepID=UPI0030FC1E1B
MKHFFFFASLILVSHLAHAQDLAGRKIVNGNLNAQVISGSNNDFTSISSSLLFGKIKSDNTYWAFGGKFALYPTNTFNNSVSIGPSVERGKFIPLVDDLYLAPYIGGSVSAIFGNTDGANINLYATPIRFMYHFKENLMLTAGFGFGNIDYTINNSVSTLSINASLNNNSGFGIFYTFK